MTGLISENGTNNYQIIVPISCTYFMLWTNFVLIAIFLGLSHGSSAFVSVCLNYYEYYGSGITPIACIHHSIFPTFFNFRSG